MEEPVDEIIERGTKSIVTTEEIEIVEAITVEDPTLEKGKDLVLREGELGEETIIYKIIYEDGKEVDREKVSTTIFKEPIDKLVEIGTKESTEEKPEEKTEETNDDNDHKSKTDNNDDKNKSKIQSDKGDHKTEINNNDSETKGSDNKSETIINKVSDQGEKLPNTTISTSHFLLFGMALLMIGLSVRFVRV